MKLIAVYEVLNNFKSPIISFEFLNNKHLNIKHTKTRH